MTTAYQEPAARRRKGEETTEESAPGPGRQWWSQSVRLLVDDAGEAITAGEAVTRLLRDHRDYVDAGIVPDGLGSVGAVRTAAQHVEAAVALWDASTTPYLTGRRVVIALAAEDPTVGGMLVLSGTLASLIDRWLPTDRAGTERTHVVWDLLSPEGRAQADEQPLLAAVLGAPAEWTTVAIGQAEWIAWAPAGSRVAALTGTAVVQAARNRPPQHVASPGRDVLGLGWGARGPTVLQAGADGGVEFRELTGAAVSTGPRGAGRGLLSGDASTAWIEAESGWTSWSPQSTGGQPLEVGVPLAVNRSGRRILVRDGGHLAVVDVGTQIGGTAPEAALTGPFAVGTVLGSAVVASTGPGGVLVGPLGGPRLARIAVGPDPVTAMAFDPDGTAIAIAVRDRIEVWPLHLRRAGNRQIARFDSDRVGGPDLLSADADATTLAGLIASEELHPPLTVGLFGAWGAGKSFVLNALERELRELTGPDRPTGFLGGLRIVRFNAWHYAETNLWASLVDEVLRQLGDELPKPQLTDLPEVRKAEADAQAAEEEVRRRRKEAQVAEERLTTLRRPARRWGITVAAVLLVVVAAGVAIALLTGLSATVVAGYGAVVTALAAALGAVAEIRSRVEDLGALGTAVGEAGGTWTRVKEVLGHDVTRAEAAVRSARTGVETAVTEAERKNSELERQRELATSGQLGSVLQRMAALTEYRDQLGLIARTRQRFVEIDRAIADLDGAIVAGPPGSAPFRRVVVMIDDLDRCPPDKVVSVLEAVHLLLDFRSFVAVIAVDTRWLEQSIQTCHRDVLSGGGATAADYLEKIIQLPVHLRPLDDDTVRSMMAGLAGAATSDTVGIAPRGPDPSRTRAARSAVGIELLRGHEPRPTRAALPAESLQIGAAQLTAMSEVAPLVGHTPRTVKRFVNTYRILKASADNLDRFDEVRHGVGDHQVVAFLLATAVGPKARAAAVSAALAARPVGTLDAALTHVDDGELRTWLAGHPAYATAPVSRFVTWSAQVFRYSFWPPHGL